MVNTYDIIKQITNRGTKLKLRYNTLYVTIGYFNDKQIQTIILNEKIMMISGFLKQTSFHIEMVVNRDINQLDKLNNIGLLTKMIIEKTDANTA